MYKPIFVLAGQSNATTIANAVENQLVDEYGTDGFILVNAFANGAPLTYAKNGMDWATQGELPNELVSKTTSALASNPDSVVEGFIWVQGEGDTYNWTNAASYSNKFKQLMNDYETRIEASFGARYTGIEDANIVISTLSDNANPSFNQTKWANIQDEHLELAQGDVDISVVDPDSVAAKAGVPFGTMFRDDLHYNQGFADHLAKALVAKAGEGVELNLPQPGPPNTAQTLVGTGAGDTFVVDHSGDRIIETAQNGHDTVESSVSFSMRDHSQKLEDLTLTGSNDVNGTGNGLGNVITGNSGDNWLSGAWGNDTLIGAGGDDTLVGGHGNDVYNVSDAGDQVKEFWNSGIDQVNSSVDFSLRDHSQFLEKLALTGNGDIHGVGNGQNNSLVGNQGDNVLNGLWGNDTLNGGGGDDTLVGGFGNDTFHVNSIGDRIKEYWKAGVDTVVSKVSFSLRDHSQNLENLTLSGSSDIDGTGNGLGNVIQGNTGDNILNGAWGNDTLIGGAGDDTLIGGAQEDVFKVGNGSDDDRIVGFQLGTDKIDVEGQSFDGPGANAQKTKFLEEHGMFENKDLFINLGDGDSVYLPDIVEEEDDDPRLNDFISIFS